MIEIVMNFSLLDHCDENISPIPRTSLKSQESFYYVNKLNPIIRMNIPLSHTLQWKLIKWYCKLDNSCVFGTYVISDKVIKIVLTERFCRKIKIFCGYAGICLMLATDVTNTSSYYSWVHLYLLRVLKASKMTYILTWHTRVLTINQHTYQHNTRFLVWVHPRLFPVPYWWHH